MTGSGEQHSVLPHRAGRGGAPTCSEGGRGGEGLAGSGEQHSVLPPSGFVQCVCVCGMGGRGRMQGTDSSQHVQTPLRTAIPASSHKCYLLLIREGGGGRPSRSAWLAYSFPTRPNRCRCRRCVRCVPLGCSPQCVQQQQQPPPIAAAAAVILGTCTCHADPPLPAAMRRGARRRGLPAVGVCCEASPPAVPHSTQAHRRTGAQAHISRAALTFGATARVSRSPRWPRPGA